MPYIEPRCDQSGEITHYRINVSAGVNYKGQPIKYRTTWRPKPGMSRSQPEREVKAFAYYNSFNTYIFWCYGLHLWCLRRRLFRSN